MENVITLEGTKELTKHPKFDYYWEANKAFVYSQAKKLGSIFHQDPKELLGTLTIRFNGCLWSYQPEKSKITTYFAKFLRTYVLESFLRKDSELMDMTYFNAKRKGDTVKKSISKKKDVIVVESLDDLMKKMNSDVGNEFVVIEPFDNSIRSFEFGNDSNWLQEVDELYPDREKLWEYLTDGLTQKQKNVILNSRNGMKEKEIAQREGYSVGTVKSRKSICLRNIKEVVKQDSKLGKLLLEVYEDAGVA